MGSAVSPSTSWATPRPRGGLNTAAARINGRELYEVFATPFEAADKLARLGAMMANYGEIDGLPVIMNPRIARKLLREVIGFEGVLTSDGAADGKKPQGPFATMYKLFSREEQAQLKDMNTVLRNMGARSLREVLADRGEVVYAQGCDIIGTSTEGFPEAVAAVGKPVTVVLYGPGVFAVNWAQEHVSAILQAFMPGQFAGKVVADALYGDVNPGGAS